MESLDHPPAAEGSDRTNVRPPSFLPGRAASQNSLPEMGSPVGCIADRVTSVAAIAAKLKPPHGGYPDCGHAFDQRPGALEATRGLAPIAVLGKRGAQNWKICLLPGGTMLEPPAARALAAELIEMADICEWRRW